MCYPNGGVVDDLLVYMRGPDDYFLCINAGNIDKDLAWFERAGGEFDVTVTDRSADYALLAVQGPQARGDRPVARARSSGCCTTTSPRRPSRACTCLVERARATRARTGSSC